MLYGEENQNFNWLGRKIKYQGGGDLFARSVFSFTFFHFSPLDDAEDNLYHRNIRRKMAFHVDPKTKQRTMQSWPLVTMSLNALKDTDIPTGIKVS